MRCQFCSQEIKPEALLCDWCGKRQEPAVSPPPIELPPPPPPSEPGRMMTLPPTGAPLRRDEPPAPSPIPETLRPVQHLETPPNLAPPPPVDLPTQLARKATRAKAFFRPAEVWGFLRRDPLLLAAFILLGLDVLRILATGSFEFFNILLVIAFFGLISWRYWAWCLAVVAVGISFFVTIPGLLVLPKITAVFGVAFTILLVFHILVGAFTVIILWQRRDYFD